MVNTMEIKIWQVRSGFRNRDVGRLADEKPPTVSKVINGKLNPQMPKAQKVIQALKKLGCPEEFLGNGAKAA